jgi:hypothetical protein
MKAFLITSIIAGHPDFSRKPFKGCVLCAITPNREHGIYIVTGTAGQIAALNALSQVYAICAVTAPANAPTWPELNDVITVAKRTRINTWLTSRGYPTIPAGWTYRQVIRTLCRRLNDNYEIDTADVLE